MFLHLNARNSRAPWRHPYRQRQIACIVGTRPEAIKFAPVVKQLLLHPDVAAFVVTTGQQPMLTQRALDCLDLGSTHIISCRGAEKGGAIDLHHMVEALAKVLSDARPDLVLVLGDTNSALAGALAAHRLRIAVGHIEAGLRTHLPLRPFPEEANRVAIARLASLHFAPSIGAARNLKGEGIGEGVFITGNPGIDALFSTAEALAPASIKREILVTCHRRENFGEPLQQICAALQALGERELRFVIPLHTNPHASDPFKAAFTGSDFVRLSPPFDYPDMIRAIKSAPLVLSDSGGLQEECGALGVPMLLMREETERPELVESGNCMLVGHDRSRIVQSVTNLIANPKQRRAMSQPHFPYGTGDSARLISTAITTHLALPVAA